MDFKRRQTLHFRSLFNPFLRFKSLLLNDRWVIESVFNGKKRGFFVEAGAFDGKFNSSCYVLEKHFGWRGICVEPQVRFYQACIKNRPSSIVENVALSDKLGTATFVDAAVPGYSGIKTELIRIEERAKRNGWIKNQWRTSGPYSERKVDTMPLHELLKKCDAPKIIDYIAMDIEGSEAPAFGGFPFDKYWIGCLSIEGPSCDDLLTAQGFVKVDNPFNQVGQWEHYFIHEDLVKSARSKSCC